MPHTNFSIELRSSYFSARALCEPRSYEREACAIFFMMFFHVPKRLQFFFALRAIILMPYKSVLMYRIRATFTTPHQILSNQLPPRRSAVVSYRQHYTLSGVPLSTSFEIRRAVHPFSTADSPQQYRRCSWVPPSRMGWHHTHR